MLSFIYSSSLVLHQTSSGGAINFNINPSLSWSSSDSESVKQKNDLSFPFCSLGNPILTWQTPFITFQFPSYVQKTFRLEITKSFALIRLHIFLPWEFSLSRFMLHGCSPFWKQLFVMFSPSQNVPVFYWSAQPLTHHFVLISELSNLLRNSFINSSKAALADSHPCIILNWSVSTAEKIVDIAFKLNVDAFFSSGVH